MSEPILAKTFHRKVQSKKIFTQRESFDTIIGKTEEKLSQVSGACGAVFRQFCVELINYEQRPGLCRSVRVSVSFIYGADRSINFSLHFWKNRKYVFNFGSLVFVRTQFPKQFSHSAGASANNGKLWWVVVAVVAASAAAAATQNWVCFLLSFRP